MLSAAIWVGCGDGSKHQNSSSASTASSSTSVSSQSTVISQAVPHTSGEGAAALALAPLGGINNISDDNIPLPNFLNNDQQKLFLAATRLYTGVGGGGHPGYQPDFSVVITQTVGGVTSNYNLDTAFENYAAFEKAIYATFTKAYGKELLSDVGIKEHDGKLYVVDADRGNVGIGFKRVTYEVVSQSEDQIEFIMRGHYQSDVTKPETTTDYPIRMLKETDGWRFDLFASPAFRS